MASTQQIQKIRPQVIHLYKQLLFLANDYPGKETIEVRQKIKDSFRKNRHLTDEDEIQTALDKGEYIKKEIESLIFLARYRELKRRYHKEDEMKESTLSYDEIDKQL